MDDMKAEGILFVRSWNGIDVTDERSVVNMGGEKWDRGRDVRSKFLITCPAFM